MVGGGTEVASTENVRAALALVAVWEAALGIVYQTDAAAEPGVKVLDTFPDELASAHCLSGSSHNGSEECRSSNRLREISQRLGRPSEVRQGRFHYSQVSGRVLIFCFKQRLVLNLLVKFR